MRLQLPAFSARGAGHQRIAHSLPALIPASTWIHKLRNFSHINMLPRVWENPRIPGPVHSRWELSLSSLSSLVISSALNLHFSFGGKASSKGEGSRVSPAFILPSQAQNQAPSHRSTPDLSQGVLRVPPLLSHHPLPVSLPFPPFVRSHLQPQFLLHR